MHYLDKQLLLILSYLRNTDNPAYSFQNMGKENAQPETLPRPDDLHLLCYTSGTTGKYYAFCVLAKFSILLCTSYCCWPLSLGRAKGVMITHKMIVSVITGFDMDLQQVVGSPFYYFPPNLLLPITPMMVVS